MENKSLREQEQFWLRQEKRLFYSRPSWSSIQRRMAFVHARLEAVRAAIAAEESQPRPCGPAAPVAAAREEGHQMGPATPCASAEWFEPLPGIQRVR